MPTPSPAPSAIVLIGFDAESAVVMAVDVGVADPEFTSVFGRDVSVMADALLIATVAEDEA